MAEEKSAINKLAEKNGINRVLMKKLIKRVIDVYNAVTSIP
jgi:hypothetical protein